MTLFLVGLAMVIAIGLFMFRWGRRSKEADVMQKVNDDAYVATKIREQAEAMGSDGVRNALRLRRTKR